MMAADDVYLDVTSGTVVPDAIRLVSSAGFCVLRGLLPASVATHYRDLTQQALDRPRDADRDRRYKYNAATAASSIQEFDHLGDGALRLLRHVFVAPVVAVHRHFLGPEFRCCLEHSRIRRQYGNADRPAHHKPHLWHRDAPKDFDGTKMMNVWAALTPCGTDSPSMDMVKGVGPDDLEISELPPEIQTMGITANPGDAVIFLGTTVHRTQQGPQLDKMRYSCDIRCMSASDAPTHMASGTFVNPALMFGV